jgi:hypothetical protein
MRQLKQPSIDMQLQQFPTSITHCHCMNLVTMIRLRNTVQNYHKKFEFNFRYVSGSSNRIRIRNNVGNYLPVQVILLLSDVFRILSRGIRTKIVQTKVSFGDFSYLELFCSEKRAFGDSAFGYWSFGDRAFGDLTVYPFFTCSLRFLAHFTYIHTKIS